MKCSIKLLDVKILLKLVLSTPKVSASFQSHSLKALNTSVVVPLFCVCDVHLHERT